MNVQAEKQPNTSFISGVSEIAEHYDAFIIDIWGVVHDGIRLNPGSKNCLEQMVTAGKKFAFLSNTPYRSEELGRDLGAMGLDVTIFENHIMTAGESTWQDLRHWKDGKVFLMGHHYDGLLEGVNLVDDVTRADCILSTVGGTYKDGDTPFYDAMEKALPLKIPYICANPDLEVQIGDNIVPCAGTYAQWYEERGGEVHWHGKPYAPVYERVWDMLGRPDKARVCAIGDSLRTDMSGAKNFGIDGLWNLDGINRMLSEEQARKLLDEKGLSPVAMMKGFKW
ncbi:MAG: TIGR01459 family HAD-type hydrolase [Bdellovibrionales bacterium]